MGKKLYVGNLAYSVTDSDLEQMFTATSKPYTGNPEEVELLVRNFRKANRSGETEMLVVLGTSLDSSELVKKELTPEERTGLIQELLKSPKEIKYWTDERTKKTVPLYAVSV